MKIISKNILINKKLKVNTNNKKYPNTITKNHYTTLQIIAITIICLNLFVVFDYYNEIL